MSPDKVAVAIARLHEASNRYERLAHLDAVELSITPPHRMPVDAELVECYADLGVTRLILLAPGETHEHQDDLLAFVAAPQTLLA